jgi:hypothetical protein
MLNDTEEIDLATSRRRRLVIRGAVLAAWAVGIVLAIKSGWDPGPWWGRSGRPWPYPLGAVVIEIAKITVISLGLYDLLRPTPEGSSLARTVRAAGVLVFTLLWIGATMWTDRPGYAYATGTYVFILTGLLLAALVGHVVMAAMRGLRRRKHAA